MAATPYEIRRDLLRLAYEIKSNECQAIAGKAAQKERAANPKVDPPIYCTEAPTVEDVIAGALRLNEFISVSVSTRSTSSASRSSGPRSVN